jgi:hypothetical protein
MPHITHINWVSHIQTLDYMQSVLFLAITGDKFAMSVVYSYMNNRVGDINMQSGININHPLRTTKVIRNVNSHMQFSQIKPVILVVLHVARKNKAYNYNLLMTSSILVV